MPIQTEAVFIGAWDKACVRTYDRVGDYSCQNLNIAMRPDLRLYVLLILVRLDCYRLDIE